MKQLSVAFWHRFWYRCCIAIVNALEGSVALFVAAWKAVVSVGAMLL
jgi:hypothetical protein